MEKAPRLLLISIWFTLPDGDDDDGDGPGFLISPLLSQHHRPARPDLSCSGAAQWRSRPVPYYCYANPSSLSLILRANVNALELFIELQLAIGYDISYSTSDDGRDGLLCCCCCCYCCCRPRCAFFPALTTHMRIARWSLSRCIALFTALGSLQITFFKPKLY